MPNCFNVEFFKKYPKFSERFKIFWMIARLNCLFSPFLRYILQLLRFLFKSILLLFVLILLYYLCLFGSKTLLSLRLRFPSLFLWFCSFWRIPWNFSWMFFFLSLSLSLSCAADWKCSFRLALCCNFLLKWSQA